MQQKLRKLILKYCIDHDMTQKDFANAINVSPALFSLMLTGKRTISESVLLDISVKMNISIDALLQHVTQMEKTYTAA